MNKLRPRSGALVAGSSSVKPNGAYAPCSPVGHQQTNDLTLSLSTVPLVMTKDRAALQIAGVVGAVLGGVTGYVLYGGWPKILIWALIGAVIVAGAVYSVRAFRP
jgi:hypothetical protein